MGAAIAYYTVFSLAPMLVMVIAVAGLAFGQKAAEGALFGELAELVGAESAAAVQAMLKPILGTSGGDEPRRSVARQGTDRRGT
jgi:membrane protein